MNICHCMAQPWNWRKHFRNTFSHTSEVQKVNSVHVLSSSSGINGTGGWDMCSSWHIIQKMKIKNQKYVGVYAHVGVLTAALGMLISISTLVAKSECETPQCESEPLFSRARKVFYRTFPFAKWTFFSFSESLRMCNFLRWKEDESSRKRYVKIYIFCERTDERDEDLGRVSTNSILRVKYI